MAAKELGGAGGPLAVLVVTIFAAAFGKLVSKETKIEIIVTPFTAIGVGVLLSQWWAPAIGYAASSVGNPKIWLPPTLASAITGPLATCLFHMEMIGAAVASGMGTCGFVGQIGVYTGWVNDIASGAKAAITPMDWIGMALICFKQLLHLWTGLGWL